MKAGRHEDQGFELHGPATPATALVAAVWRSRGLLAMLARKDFFVRYRRASFGVLWAVGLPAVQAVVLAIVFSRIVRVATPGRSYPLFVFSGVLAWTFFSTTVSVAATSIVDGWGMSTRIYFPRALFPLVPVVANLYGFVLSLGVLLAMMGVTGSFPGIRLLLLLPATAVLVALTASLSLVLAALHVYFRDVRYLLQAALLAWFYVTPVIYPMKLAGGLARWLRLNPMTGAVELLRVSTVGADPGWVISLWWSLAWTAVLCVAALLLHRRFDRVFADLL